MSLEIKFVPLSFITEDEEVLNQIKNTVLFSHLLRSHEETILSHYLESTQYGYTASASETGTHQIVRITDINSGKVNWSTVPYCNCDTEDKYLLKSNDILIARTGGTTGKSFIVNSAPINAVFASYLIRLRMNYRTSIDFINLFLNSYAFWGQIVEMKSGSAMPNVNAEKLKTLKIPKLSLDEQNKVLTEFNQKETSLQVFTKIQEVESLFTNSRKTKSQLTHQLDLVKQLRQAFLREAMQGKLVPQDPNDEPASVLLEKIKAEKALRQAQGTLKKQKPLPPITEEEIPFDIPENWVWCRLGDACIKITDGTHHSPTNTPTGKYMYVTAKNIKNEGVDLSKITFVKKEVHDEIFSRCDPEFGDILYIKDGATTGIVTINNLSEPFSLLSSVALLKFDSHICNRFIMFVMRSPVYYDATRRNMYGVALTRVTLAKINNSIIPLPPLSEQQRIVAKLDELMQYCDELEASIKESQQQNELLLQQVLREALEPDGKEIEKV